MRPLIGCLEISYFSNNNNNIIIAINNNNNNNNNYKNSNNSNNNNNNNLQTLAQHVRIIILIQSVYIGKLLYIAVGLEVGSLCGECFFFFVSSFLYIKKLPCEITSH